MAVNSNDVNENENIELAHYLSYMIVYYVLQVTCIITVCIIWRQKRRSSELLEKKRVEGHFSFN
jgi:uncharacterized Tic20 family protein